jgi:hypothetical protein
MDKTSSYRGSPTCFMQVTTGNPEGSRSFDDIFVDRIDPVTTDSKDEARCNKMLYCAIRWLLIPLVNKGSKYLGRKVS